MTYFTIGVEDHYGWANLVSVAASGPEITVLDKRRVDLIEPNLATSPYHTKHCKCENQRPRSL